MGAIMSLLTMSRMNNVAHQSLYCLSMSGFFFLFATWEKPEVSKSLGLVSSRMILIVLKWGKATEKNQSGAPLLSDATSIRQKPPCQKSIGQKSTHQKIHNMSIRLMQISQKLCSSKVQFVNQ